MARRICWTRALLRPELCWLPTELACEDVEVEDDTAEDEEEEELEEEEDEMRRD